jgi:anti-sigma factor RsiW
MNCSQLSQLLHAYSDRELGVVDSLDVEQHLKSCSACAAAERSIQSIRSVLRESELAFTAPPELRKRVRATLREISGEARTSEPRQWLWQFLAIGACAFAVLTLVLRPTGFTGVEQIANEAVAGHIRSLAPGHLTDVASSDQHTVKPWFNGKIDFAPDVKDFAADGFPLVGGRLDYLNNQTVAALVYRRNQHLINVFVWPANQPIPEDVRHQRGFFIINRDWNGMHHFVISDLNQKELSEFAALLSRQH